MRRNTYGTKYYINNRIRADKLRVISDGENIGVLTKHEAIDLARQKGLDLVLIAPQANPPVAKILDYNKFLYTERKKESASRSKSKKSELKEFKMRPGTDEGDIQRYAERAKGFIKEGNRVRISVVMRGRENTLPQVALEQIADFESYLGDTAKKEGEPKRTGNTISVVYVNK